MTSVSTIKSVTFGADPDVIVLRVSIPHLDCLDLRLVAPLRKDAAGHWFLRAVRLIAMRQASWQETQGVFPGVELTELEHLLGVEGLTVPDFRSRFRLNWAQLRCSDWRRLQLWRPNARAPMHDPDIVPRILGDLFPKAKKEPLRYFLGVDARCIEGLDDSPLPTDLSDIFGVAVELGLGPSAHIRELARNCHAIGPLLFPWISNRVQGYGPLDISIRNRWDTKVVRQLWEESGPLADYPNLTRHGEPFKTIAEGPRAIEVRRTEKLIRPKTWVSFSFFPHDDKDLPEFEFGMSDYAISCALEEAHERPVRVGPTSRNPQGWAATTLRALYEEDALDIAKDFPSIVCAQVSVRTSDGYLIVAQRGGDDQVRYCPSQYSGTAEEQMDPRKEWHPTDTAVRCLSEEFGIKGSEGIPVPRDAMRYLAFGREWTAPGCWSTVLIYAVTLEATKDQVLDVRRRKQATSAKELRAIVSVPLRTKAERQTLIQHLVADSFDGSWFPKDDRVGTGFTQNRFHVGTGMPRILCALAHWYGGPRALLT